MTCAQGDSTYRKKDQECEPREINRPRDQRHKEHSSVPKRMLWFPNNRTEPGIRPVSGRQRVDPVWVSARCLACCQRDWLLTRKRHLNDLRPYDSRAESRLSSKAVRGGR